MRWVREGQQRRWIGPSYMPKPVLGAQIQTGEGSVQTIIQSDLLEGSTALEADTGRVFVYDGEKWSYAYGGETRDLIRVVVTLTETVGELVKEIKALRLGMIDAGTAKWLDTSEV